MPILLRKKTISTILILCLLVNCLGYYAYAGVLPTVPNPLSQQPLLKYLSINSANPYNYFNFLVDTGENTLNGRTQGPPLQDNVKQLINYFFLGLTLPKDSFWVNLKPTEPDRITSSELLKTDMGKILLEQDLLLKKDTAKYLHPKNFKGKEFWEKLYQGLSQRGLSLKKLLITTSNRVWIVPDKATIVETETGALIVEAKLKVLLESEYLNLHLRSASKVQELSEQLMREIIVPELTSDVNSLPKYAPLRQIYHSLILAEYYKKKYSGLDALYSQVINKNQTQRLESQFPWSKDKIWQQYLKSYKNGEYKLKHKFSGINRMYFSGGIIFYGDIHGLENIKIIKTSSSLSKVYTSPFVSSPMTLAIMDTHAKQGNTYGEVMDIITGKQEASSSLEVSQQENIGTLSSSSLKIHPEIGVHISDNAYLINKNIFWLLYLNKIAEAGGSDLTIGQVKKIYNGWNKYKKSELVAIHRSNALAIKGDDIESSRKELTEKIEYIFVSNQ